jgi:hypothetical protein
MQTAVMRGLIPTLAAVLVATSSAASAAGEQPPICTDRPSKSTGECTVPQGNWQIETGLIDWTHDSSGGVRTDATSWGGSLIKYGISNNADLELQFTPLETLNVDASSAHESHSSFGDMIVRAKYRLTRADAPLLIALDPFVELPTANHHLGNGKVEGGLVVGTSAALGKSGLTLSLDPELDLNADADGSGRHLATQQVLNVGVAASEKLSLSTEVWAKWNWDPAGTVNQLSWDVAGAYQPTKTLQLDAGANFGLDSQTPDVEVYSGVSVRF